MDEIKGEYVCQETGRAPALMQIQHSALTGTSKALALFPRAFSMVEEGGRMREAAVGLKQTGRPSFAGADYAVYKDRGL